MTKQATVYRLEAGCRGGMTRWVKLALKDNCHLCEKPFVLGDEVVAKYRAHIGTTIHYHLACGIKIHLLD